MKLAAIPTQVLLAPMEGVINADMRATLTALGGYTRCVTEFVRVTDVLLPERVFHRLCPELLANGRTPAGTPVFVQLLGSDAPALALNARRAATLGAPGVDLNFGCPARTVNRSQGGSILLQHPDKVARLVSAVREATPPQVPVTVKVRLGYHHSEDLEAIVSGIRAAGADELCIHARTRDDGYRPPAHWGKVRPVMRQARWPLVTSGYLTTINGEIWNVADARAACRASGCSRVMLGRGALAAPDLARRILAGDSEVLPMPWLELQALVLEQFERTDTRSARHVGNRTKQWLAYLQRHYPQAAELFTRIRRLHDAAAIRKAFGSPSLAPA